MLTKGTTRCTVLVVMRVIEIRYQSRQTIGVLWLIMCSKHIPFPADPHYGVFSCTQDASTLSTRNNKPITEAEGCKSEQLSVYWVNLILPD